MESIKVLLIDDDVMMLRIISTVLERKGYRVYTCQTAENIFATVGKYIPDIILMDHEMPTVSGIEAIGQLKSNVLSRAIPIIFFTVHEHMAEQAIKAGAAMHVSKSSTAEHLEDCINSLVNVQA